MKIVIIGAQAAGASAAAKAKRLLPTAQITMYECSDVIAFGACGLPYFIGGAFNDTQFMLSRSVKQFQDQGIDVKTGHRVLTVNINDKTLTIQHTATGITFQDNYDRLLIATGAHPLVPPLNNRNLANVFTLKTLADGLAVRQAALSSTCNNVTIIGAGFIGLEMAEAMLTLNKRVTIIQLEQRVLADYFDEEITTLIEQQLLAAGVQLQMPESVQALQGQTALSGVVTNQAEYPTDLALICTGVTPATGFLDNTGISRLANGAIVIDEHCRTNLNDVYAAGDCASVYHRVTGSNMYIPLATTANKIGRIAGENLAGQAAVFAGTLGTAAIRMMSIEAGRTGLTQAAAVKANIPYQTVFIKDKNHSNFLPDQTDIAVKLIYHQTTGQLLGGQVAGGSGAALRTNVLATAIWNGMTVQQLGMMDFLYAPPFSRPWDALNIAANAAK